MGLKSPTAGTFFYSGAWSQWKGGNDETRMTAEALRDVYGARETKDDSERVI